MEYQLNIVYGLTNDSLNAFNQTTKYITEGQKKYSFPKYLEIQNVQNYKLVYTVCSIIPHFSKTEKHFSQTKCHAKLCNVIATCSCCLATVTSSSLACWFKSPNQLLNEPCGEIVSFTAASKNELFSQHEGREKLNLTSYKKNGQICMLMTMCYNQKLQSSY